MLVYEDIIAKLKNIFPRWMDIRRKVNSSIGGNYLKSIASVIADIQSAINDYKKEFFIDNYFGKEEKILSFLYKLTIGIPNSLSEIKIINPENYSITNDENLFYENDNYIYYNDGVLYSKIDFENFQYSINDYICDGIFEKIHVWNIFDEFAIFLGLRRYQWESNYELEQRILSYGSVSNKVNSSNDGLKKALIANLINIAPDISNDDILIERPTAENLVKYYDQFETILDHMMKINKDVYKEKQWDIDLWNFSIKSIDYIPHAWDVLLNDYVNGVGFKDDLKIQLIDKNQKCDVTVLFYKKKLEELNAYIKNNNIAHEIKFNLTKYYNEIKEQKVKYRITSSEAIKLKTDKISFTASEEKTGDFDLNIQDIISDYSESDLIINDKSILSEDYNYVIDFIPTNPIGDFSIDYCKQINLNTNETKNLLEKNRNGFIVNGDGVKSSTSKLYITDMYQLESSDNIKKTIYGFELKDLSKTASLQINIDGCRFLPFYYEYENKETILNLTDFVLTNSYIYNNCIISDTVEGTKTAEIELDLNSFSCTIKGPYKIEYKLDDNDKIILQDKNNNTFDFKIDKSNNPRHLNLKITFLRDNCKLKDARYSKYNFNVFTKNGTINNSNNDSFLPNFDINSLIFNIRSYVGFSPVIKYIYIGNKLTNNNGYYNIHFNTINGTKLHTKYKNCRLQLKQYTKDTNELVNTFYDYKPYKEYTAKNDTAITLDLKSYLIEKLNSEYGQIKTDTINEINKKYFLYLNTNETLMNIVVSGTSYLPIIDCTLSSIIEKLGYDLKHTEFYVSKNENNIIVKNNIINNISYLKITRQDLFNDTSISTVNVSVEDDRFITKFIENNTIEYTDNYGNNFDYISFEPINSNIYTAINEYNMFTPYKKDISIVNTFNNNYQESKEIMFYTVESLSEDFFVRFQTDDIFEHCVDKILDETYIAIKGKNVSNFNYNKDTISTTVTLPLGSTIEIPSSFNINGSEIDIRKYIIEDFDINYSNLYNDPDNENDYKYIENITVPESGIIKLKYSNIYEIESVTFNGILLTDSEYQVLYKEGIIIFNSLYNGNAEIKYNFNIAKSINIKENDLYEIINYPVNSMTVLNSIYFKNVEIDTPINLTKYKDYIDCDLVTVQCSIPGFFSRIDNGNLILSNNTPENSVAIKTGYYYMNGKEYYLLSDIKSDNVNKIDNINYHNVTKDNYSLILKLKSSNFLQNTEFNLNTKADIYDLNCNDKEIISVSDLNEICACDNFNYWNNYMCTLGITNGYNGQGLSFSSNNYYKGYCYICLDRYINKNKKYILSFYLSSGYAYLGKEKIITDYDTEFNYESVIEIDKQINKSTELNDFYEISFINEDNCKYYLILSGSGIIDDIIISEEDKYDIYNHIKNLTQLNLDINENIYTQYQTRLYVLSEDGAIFDGTEINSNGFLINSSYINWGYTKLKTLNSYDDFKNCIIQNVDFKQFDNKCSLTTSSINGLVETMPIFINNIKIVKNLLFKINSILFDDTKNLNIKVLTSYNKNTGYKEIAESKNNICIVNGNYIKKYVKLLITIPAGKRLDSVDFYAEYLSNNENYPTEQDVTDGIYISKVLDAQYNERFLLKAIDIEGKSTDNFICQIRASKENTENTVWTEWKTIEIQDNNITNRIVFDKYRYFQFRIELKGEHSYLKINHIDLEVI